MRYFIYISYLGKAYSGWQIQKNGLAVQQVIEEALGKVLAKPTPISGSSRTDKGVHAAQQVAHFDCTTFINFSDFIYRMNRILPSDITIKAIRRVVDDAHARFDACYRKYAYTIIKQKNPFYKDQAIWLNQMPPLTLLNTIASLFCVETDFEFFSKKTDIMNNFICNITHAGWSEIDQKLVFHITANRFLRGMVRAIVSIMLKVANNKMDLRELAQRIKVKSNIRPVLTLMPPNGLVLMEVGYPVRLFIT